MCGFLCQVGEVDGTGGKLVYDFCVIAKPATPKIS
jgi:hypothetical protein